MNDNNALTINLLRMVEAFIETPGDYTEEEKGWLLEDIRDEYIRLGFKENEEE